MNHKIEWYFVFILLFYQSYRAKGDSRFLNKLLYWENHDCKLRNILEKIEKTNREISQEGRNFPSIFSYSLNKGVNIKAEKDISS